MQIVDPGDDYVLNCCTKPLSRIAPAAVLTDGAGPVDDTARISEAWRFPIIGGVRRTEGDASDGERNMVTFVYKSVVGDARPIQILGTFATLVDPIPLKAVLFDGEDTGFRSRSVVLPKAQVYTYKYLLDGRYVVDPINPQRVRLANGRTWSRFFTDGYLQPIILEPWELRLLYRIIEQILPFRGGEAENFLKRYYFGLNRDQRKTEMPKAFRLDDSVGEVNAIDKFLAREEAHRLIDYRLCLVQIDRVLRRKNPSLDPYDMPAEDYVQLYDAMAASHSSLENPIPGWNYDAYGNPAFFLYLLRRHAVTAAFCHPRYAGNVGAAGWAYLSERFKDKQGHTLFDWRPSFEPPLGTSQSYR